jgi:hypothetical protein
MRAGDLTITVSKDSLLATLKGNRAKHGEAFKKAKEGYIKVTTEQLEAYVRRLADGELLEHRFINSPPEDHTTDYDDAIDMMEWSTDGTIELTQSQFVQYVKDDWGWKDNWVASTAAYIEAAR